jgi:hypothetical protein
MEHLLKEGNRIADETLALVIEKIK